MREVGQEAWGEAEGLRVDLLPTVPDKAFQLGLLLYLSVCSHLHHPLLSPLFLWEGAAELIDHRMV